MLDSEVLAHVRQRLSATGHHDLNQVQAAIEDGHLVLRGRVVSFYMKQVAQTSIQGRINGFTIRNLLEVQARSS